MRKSVIEVAAKSRTSGEATYATIALRTRRTSDTIRITRGAVRRSRDANVDGDGYGGLWTSSDLDADRTYDAVEAVNVDDEDV